MMKEHIECQLVNQLLTNKTASIQYLMIANRAYQKGHYVILFYLYV